MGQLGTECPLCGFTLKSQHISREIARYKQTSTRGGYRCVKCHAHFSAQYIGKLRRQQFKELIGKHFDSHAPTHIPAMQVHEKINVIIEDKDGKIEQALQETHTVIHQTTEHLEDLLSEKKPKHERVIHQAPPVKKSASRVRAKVRKQSKIKRRR
jgi:hypothetical protein